MSDVREAAERLRASKLADDIDAMLNMSDPADIGDILYQWKDKPITPRMAGTAAYLLRKFAADNPADSDEAITGEWLATVSNSGSHGIYKFGHRFEVRRRAERWQVWAHATFVLTSVFTRGELRRLMADLGITTLTRSET